MKPVCPRCAEFNKQGDERCRHCGAPLILHLSPLPETRRLRRKRIPPASRGL